MRYLVIIFIIGFNYFVGIYYGLFNLIYTFLLVSAIFSVINYIRIVKLTPFKDIHASSYTPPVSIIIPAYNEENVIVRAVRAGLGINYSDFEIIVVNDGSTDRTLYELINTFNLKKVDMVYRDIIKTEPVMGFYYNPDIPELIVIDKKRGGKSDALNCGINISRSPYFCSIDADSVIEKDALLRLMVPVMKSKIPVIACGGVVRILNGSFIENGEVKKIDLPRDTLSLLQIVEYIRGFLFGRAGWNVINSILILSGAFSLFYKETVIKAGGYDRNNVSEDMELIVRLHKYCRDNRIPYRIRFISDPICWTEAPDSLKMLARQRRRWHTGLLQTIIKYRRMLFNPLYGRIGLFIMPYYLFFEGIGPVIEILGYPVVIGSFLIGIIDIDLFLLFLALALLYGIFLSVAGIFLEEITYRRYPLWSHFLRLLLYGILENFGYRQINSFWRLHATMKLIYCKREWEYIKKRGENNHA